MTRIIDSLVGEPVSQLNADVTSAGSALAPNGDPGAVRTATDRALGAAAARAVLNAAELLAEPAHDVRALKSAHQVLWAARTTAIALANPTGHVEGIDAVLHAVQRALDTTQVPSA